MRKVLSVLLCLLLVVFSLSVNAADIKKSVCIVRSDDPEMDSLSMRLGDILQRNGYISSGRTLLKGVKSYGSGFVFQTSSGSRYVITNRHVVKNAKKVQLEFKSDSGSKVYEDCNVLFLNLKQDVAVIALPANADVTALKSLNAPVTEGQDVYTAGYPALGGSPLWQYGKGIVSNAVVNTGTVGDKDSVFVIQHTAQVDAGNSGGPLLVQNVESGDTTYFVVGINTWKALWRESTNYSTRIAELEELIKEYEKNQTVSDAYSLKETAENFAVDVTKGYRRIAKYMSTKMLLGLSDSQLINILQDVSDSIASVIRSEDPIYGVKLLVAKEICSKIKNASQIKLQSANDNGNETGSTVYALDKSKFSFDWVHSLEGWYISKSSLIGKVNDAKTLGYNSHNSNSRRRIGLTTIVPIHESQGTGFLLHYYTSYKYFLYGYGAGVMATHGMTLNSYWGNPIPGKYNSNTIWGLSWDLAFGAQVPFQIKKIAIVPHVLLGGGGEYLAVYGNYRDIFAFVQLKAGLRVGYMFENGNQVYIAPEYKCRIISSLQFDNKEKLYPHVFGIMVGFEWLRK